MTDEPGPTYEEVVEAALAFRDLNACFRLQRAPSDALHRRLAKADKVAAALVRAKDGKTPEGAPAARCRRCGHPDHGLDPDKVDALALRANPCPEPRCMACGPR